MSAALRQEPLCRGCGCEIDEFAVSEWDGLCDACMSEREAEERWEQEE